ncbi:MAG: hypothetical protein D3926_20810 [Desulfobacteraceae bacterium]|nr:MAG: hypothetical protein D3926_20810 [Desulfobacteraceae bacterium]
MKKSLIIFVAVLTLFSFGTASSAHAVVDLVALTVVLGTGFASVVTGAEMIKNHQDEKDPDQALQMVPADQVEDDAQAIPDTSVLSPG